MRAEGCTKIYGEKQSGISDKRPLLRKLLREVRPGDIVIFAALDRLTREGPYKTLQILEWITSRGATYKSLAEPWADTTTELGEVLAALVGYMVCSFFASVAYLWYVYYLVAYAVCLRRLYESETGKVVVAESRKERKRAEASLISEGSAVMT